MSPAAQSPGEVAVLAEVSVTGTEDALVERVAQVMRRLVVDTVITFDPRHGVTCHGEHRLTGALAMLAAERTGLPRSRVLLLGSSVYVREASPGDVCLLGYSATAPGDTALRALAPTDEVWRRSVDVLRTHGSQFSASMVSAAATAPASLPTTWYLWASAAVENDPRYANACP
jgi:LmbE family N-acetylglucosaminyl deacetylase